MSNKILCMVCLTEVESKTRHDYQVCGCPQGTMIDGGDDYTRAGGKDLAKVKMYRQGAATGLVFIPEKIIDDRHVRGHVVYQCETCDKRLECIGDENCVQQLYRYLVIKI